MTQETDDDNRVACWNGSVWKEVDKCQHARAMSVDWRDTCPFELKVQSPPVMQEYDHFEIEAQYFRFYFHWHKITIRIPRWLADWLSFRCDCVCAELKEVHVIRTWRDNTP